ncbi:MAG: SCO family protein [Bacteroidia bacterium]
MKKNLRPLMLLASILAGAGLTYIILYYTVGFGQQGGSKGNAEGSLVRIMPIMEPNPAGGGDSVIHTVGSFQFVDQLNKEVTEKSLLGKIWVADVFFTTCQGICPQLSSGLQRVQEAFKGDSEVRLVSFSVDPDYDSIPLLQEYGKRYGADDAQWSFLTGNKTDLYRVENDEFFFGATRDADSTIKFVHDNTLRLVDKQGRFRGRFYDGTLPADVDSLISDIKKLKHEYSQIQ